LSENTQSLWERACSFKIRTTRKQIILRTNDTRCDDFGALFAIVFGNRYADTPPPPGNIIIGGVYGRHEGAVGLLHHRNGFGGTV
jgi:hypothetical protein